MTKEPLFTDEERKKAKTLRKLDESEIMKCAAVMSEKEVRMALGILARRCADLRKSLSEDREAAEKVWTERKDLNKELKRLKKSIVDVCTKP